ncbi:MAG: hypothetical protein Q8Q07_06045 [Dehalococcoidales bacterium]|nr:hypothetical protein [Dehalococcoidales bacterium]
MKLKIFVGLIVVFLLAGGCAPGRDFDTRLDSIVKPDVFSLAQWQSMALIRELSQNTPESPENTGREIEMITEYFSATGRIKALKAAIDATSTGNAEHDASSLEVELNALQARKEALKDGVERIIERQIAEAMAGQGIFNPVTAAEFTFPPVNFKLEELPYLLVISPRERIESIREITLKPGLTLEEIENIEARADELEISSLVMGIGGLGVTYPTLVTSDAGLRFTLEAVAEEWLHQYLAFKPLGFLYLLDLTGLSPNYEIAIMNETTAGMVSKEIGAIVYQKYYSEYEQDAGRKPVAEINSDFNLEMREIRKTVDDYLSRGEVEQAEDFMEQKRQYLSSLGYHIRKLNQAYFAFHGAYGDSPTSISPIGLELRQLRSQSASLKDFLNTAAALTSRQKLKDSLQQTAQ